MRGWGDAETQGGEGGALTGRSHGLSDVGASLSRWSYTSPFHLSPRSISIHDHTHCREPPQKHAPSASMASPPLQSNFGIGPGHSTPQRKRGPRNELASRGVSARASIQPEMGPSTALMPTSKTGWLRQSVGLDKRTPSSAPVVPITRRTAARTSELTEEPPPAWSSFPTRQAQGARAVSNIAPQVTSGWEVLDLSFADPCRHSPTPPPKEHNPGGVGTRVLEKGSRMVGRG